MSSRALVGTASESIESWERSALNGAKRLHSDAFRIFQVILHKATHDELYSRIDRMSILLSGVLQREGVGAHGFGP